MKPAVKILYALVFAGFLALLFPIQVEVFIMHVLYLLSAAAFSLGLGLIATFNMHGVKNPSYIDQLRRNIERVRFAFLAYFSVSTGCYLLDFYLRQNDASLFEFTLTGYPLIFNVSVFFSLVMLHSIFYFIINFIAIQKLNNDIFDRVSAEN